MLPFLFIVNSGSGANNTTAGWGTIISSFFEDKPETFSVYNLPENFTVKQIRDQIKNTRPANVVAVGGDGTVTMLANIIAGSGIALGILPGGSANGMAKELGITEKASDALQIIYDRNIQHCDLIKINKDEYCLHLSDIGLNAHLIKHFEEGKLRGKFGYAMVVLKTLLKKEKMQVAIKTGTLEVKRNAFMVVLANARMYGTGAVINPEGSLTDGLFEVIIIRRLSLTALLKMLVKPGMFDPKKIEIFPCKSVQISTRSKVHFQIDGEYKGRVKNISAEINEGTLKMIVPTVA